MENIQNWFTGLDANLQVYYVCAIISSIIFLVQMTMTLIGVDSDVDMDVNVDFDGDTTDFGGLSLFSVRGIVNFFLGFGWAGVSLWGHVANIWVLYAVSIGVGLLLAYSCLFLIRKLKKLESNGAYKISDAVGKTCNVYLRIPAERKGIGKVQVSVGGSIHEIGAVTDGEELPTNCIVKIVEVVDSNTVLVSK